VAVTLFAFGLPLYGSVFIIGGHLFVVAFGPAWADAGVYAQVLAPSLLLWSVASPLSSMLVVGRRERESVLFTTVELGARVASILIGGTIGSPLAAVVLLGLSGVLLNLTGIWRFLRPAGVTPWDILPATGAIALVNVPGFVLLALVTTGPPAWWSVAAFAVTVAFGLGAAFFLIVRHGSLPGSLG
jgi:O-antigen/teichoic acid export membrane protein